MVFSSLSQVAALAVSSRSLPTESSCRCPWRSPHFFNGLHQVRVRRLQAPAANAARRLPDHYHRLTDSLVVDASHSQQRLVFPLVVAFGQ